jgi:hypothetical protein
MVDNPEKETPLTLCLFISPILALTYRMQTPLNVTNDFLTARQAGNPTIVLKNEASFTINRRTGFGV